MWLHGRSGIDWCGGSRGEEDLRAAVEADHKGGGERSCSLSQGGALSLCLERRPSWVGRDCCDSRPSLCSQGNEYFERPSLGET